MKILVLGAGAVGGYFGGRLAEAGLDVTFLVRPARRDILARHGISVTSPFGGDFAVKPKAITQNEVTSPFDLIILSCKAYDLSAAMDAIAPAVGSDTLILPLLNGLRQIDLLQERFGAERVLGGICYIGAALNSGTGAINHFGKFHRIIFGPLHPNQGNRVAEIAALNERIAFDLDLSPDILQDMWDKCAMQAALSCANVITGGTVGEILDTPTGETFLLSCLAECRDTAEGLGHPLTPKTLDLYHDMFTTRGSTFATSTLRDVQSGQRTEGDHIIGDLVRRAEATGLQTPILRCALARLQTYEALREKAAG